jgi:KDO2-lipid IV(A) lauroyltransferase
MKQTLRRIVELRKEHKKSIIGFISDQLPKWNSIHHFTPFLNHDTAVFSGTEQIARKFNALVFYGDMHRLARGYYVCDFKLVEDKPADLSEYELTDRYMQMLETTIRRRPEFWLWSHKRWHRTKEEWERRQMEEKKHG